MPARDEVDEVVTVGRRATGQDHPKLREIVPPDLWDLSAVADELSGFDACYFCLGVSSAGMSEADYRRVTYDLTLAVARRACSGQPRACGSSTFPGRARTAPSAAA